MRFGIPRDYDLEEVETYRSSKSLFLPGPEHDQTASDALKHILEDRVLKENKQLNTYALVADILKRQESIIRQKHREYEESLCKRKYEQYSKEKRNVDTIIKGLSHELHSFLSLQNSNVERMIQQEEKRKKEEELERKRQEAEEKRRKEEAKKKQQEEERRQQLEEQKRAKEAAKKLEEEKRKQTEEREKLAIEKKKKERQNKGLTVPSEVEREFLSYKKDISDIKLNVVQPVSENKDLKKALGALKRKLNPKFGQLSSSFRQLELIFSELSSLVEQAKATGELGYKWILNFIAKAIVDQCETEVTVKPAASLPLARLAYRILQTYSEFEYFLLARLVKKCPYIIGYTCAIDTEEGRFRMGWRKQDGKWLDEVKYEERVAGICTMWSVMCRLPEQAFVNFSITASWKFLARIANTNLALLINAHFSCLSNWWDASALEFSQMYGKQAAKLMKLVSLELTNKMAEKRFPSAARLLILGEDLFNNNKIETFKEMES